MADLTFVAGIPKGLSVRDLLGWIARSQDFSSRHYRPLTLPALQRNGTWRPNQVLDLWRSVLDGMPIGLFYLQPAGRKVVDPKCRTRLVDAPADGAWDLFDGQQRLRALGLGAGDPFGEGRCIWVKFEEDTYTLVLSSTAQPAGYKADGRKRSISERSIAALEPFRSFEDGRGVLNQSQAQDDWTTLPYPFGCSSCNTVRISDLLRPMLSEEDAEADETIIPDGTSETSRERLRKCFAMLSQKRAVFVLLPEEITQSPDKTLDLFRRVGAGGTPLSQAEQVYSAYKLTYPEIREVVETIHDTVSAVLTPAQIIQAALRMAHIQANPLTGWTPGTDTVITELRKKEGKKPDWINNLNNLLHETQGGEAPLTRAFRNVRALLSKATHAGPFYLPEIVMAQLPSEVWQVLVFWAVLADPNTSLDRDEAVRFGLAWHLAVTNNEKAAQVSFRYLVGSKTAHFPGKELFHELVAAGLAYWISQPEELQPLLEPKRNDPHWLTHEERFPHGAEHRDLASTWWFSRKILPWLQREYLEKHFSSYRALSDHEDDLPYDWDHICPRAHWSPDGRTFKLEDLGFDKETERNRMMAQPWMVGDSVGNMRLVDFQQNRGDGKAGIFKKMPFLDRPETSPDLGSAYDFLMAGHEALSLWKQVDQSDTPRWSPERLEAFQRVVEQRTAMLYAEFFHQLRFDRWQQVPSKSVSDPV